jgi:acyl-CoA reductase-like NAD-dependent aldehyde dehydrogenase
MGSLASAARSTGITSSNPANGRPLGDVPEQSAAEVRAAVEAARAAQRDWAKLPLEARYPYKDSTFRALLRRARLLFGKRPWQR